MRVKRFVATNIEEAMSKIKMEMGLGAVILHTRYFQEGGFLGLFKRKYVEVTAATDESETPMRLRPQGLTSEEAVTKQTAVLQAITPNAVAAHSTTASMLNHSLNRKAHPQEAPKTTGSNLSQRDINGTGLNQEISQMKNMMSEMTQILEASGAVPAYPKAGQDLYLRLKRQGVEDRLARRVIKNTLQEVAVEPSMREALTEEIFRSSLLKPIKKSKPISLAKSTQNKPQIFALVGPTGVGKTTTIAKLAANFAITEQRKVAFITVDTYRIAAVEQLRTIGDIMDVPVRVVYSVDHIQDCLLEFADRDLIFIDTAGRSHKNEEQMAELKDYLDIISPDKTFLVMSSTAQYQDMLDILKAYQEFMISSLILTKVDETSFYGSIYNIACRSKIPLAYITTGQEIPNDIEVADPIKLVQLIMEEQ